MNEPGAPSHAELQEAFRQAEDALKGLQQSFLATPYRPTGLGTPARTVVRLVDELNWLHIVLSATQDADGVVVNQASCVVKRSAATVLEQAATVLEDSSEGTGHADRLRAALADLDAALGEMEHNATFELPVRRVAVSAGDGVDGVRVTLPTASPKSSPRSTRASGRRSSALRSR